MPERKRRGHSRFVFFFILILVVLASLTWFSYRGLCSADWLTIKTIRIAGNENVSNNTIQALLHEFTGQNLVDVSSHKVQKQLLKIKRVSDVRVTKLFPSTLKVKICERKGFLYLKSAEGDLFPIDENRMVMEYSAFSTKEDLPLVDTPFPSNQLHVGRVINDPFLKRVTNLQKQIMAQDPAFLNSISEYYLENGQVVIVDAKYGTRILLGTEALKDQLRRYQFVQDNGELDRQKIFDLRYKDQVVVRREVE